jgi:hypothetical protein
MSNKDKEILISHEELLDIIIKKDNETKKKSNIKDVKKIRDWRRKKDRHVRFTKHFEYNVYFEKDTDDMSLDSDSDSDISMFSWDGKETLYFTVGEY